MRITRLNRVADALSRATPLTVAPITRPARPSLSRGPHPEMILDFPSAAAWKEAMAEDRLYGPYLRYLKDSSEASETDRLRFDRWALRFEVVADRLYLKRPGSVAQNGLLVVPEKFLDGLP